MNNAEFSGKPQNSLAGSGDDIPAALRDTSDVSKVRDRSPILLWIGGIGGFIILATISGFVFSLSAPKTVTTSQSTSGNTNEAKENSVNSEDNSDRVLGHLAYAEAPASELVGISGHGHIKMRKIAAEKLQAMIEAARGQGVKIVPISGFRTVKEQENLFFEVGAQRNQTPAQRAAVSAPPNYSEHHTGYAVDVGDGTLPATNLSPNFEKTPAFKWLQANAARYGFELSFPQDNPQGVSYEPWHWRFVGDRHSLETFYRAKHLKPQLPENSTTPTSP